VSSRLFKQVVILVSLVGVIVILAVNAATPIQQIQRAEPHQRSVAECKQIVSDVTNFTKRYLSGRERQVIHCQAGYVTFEANHEGAHLICTAPISEYHKGQYFTLFTHDCVALSYDRPHKPKPKKSGINHSPTLRVTYTRDARRDPFRRVFASRAYLCMVFGRE
jgi:hypothetical protein